MQGQPAPEPVIAPGMSGRSHSEEKTSGGESDETTQRLLRQQYRELISTVQRRFLPTEQERRAGEKWRKLIRDEASVEAVDRSLPLNSCLHGGDDMGWGR